MIRKHMIMMTLLLSLSGIAQAQQDPIFSQYMFNMMAINPAYAGHRELLSVSAMSRSQWVGVDGAPTSSVLTADFALKEKKIGLGIQLFNDKIGITRTTGVTASYAYRLKFKKGVLAMGLQGGFNMFKANYADVEFSDGNSDIAFQQNINEVNPNIGAGVFYSTDRFYAGFSAPHLLHMDSYYASANGEGDYQRNHWLLTAGYVFDLTPDIALKPSVLLRVVSGAPITADINANIWFYNLVSFGVSVRTSRMFVGMVEIQATKQFRLGYAYDYTTSGLTTKGSHELMLRYEFGYEKKRMYSPRYF
jgi:type IX secretion system PorP/SprF family membrane protein